MSEQLLRWPAVKQACGISRPTAWRLEQQGRFPRRRQLSANAVGWLRSEIESWVLGRSQIGRVATQENRP